MRAHPLMHAGLGLLYAILIFLCAKVLVRFSLSPVAAGIGILLFAIDDAHSLAAGWISSYNTMLCPVFGLFALLMHDRWRGKQSIGALLLFIVAFMASLLSSEGGLALLGYLLAYSLFIESGTWQKKVSSLIPSVIIASAYLVFYITQHFGAKACFTYLSPFDVPWRTLFAILSNTVLLTLSQILSFPPLSTALTFAGFWGVAIASILLAATALIFRKFLRSNRVIAFFGTSMVLSIVPFTVGAVMDRLLLWASIGATGLLGAFLTMQIAKADKLKRAFANTLFITNIFLSPIFFMQMLLIYPLFENPGKALEKNIPEGNTVLLNGNMFAMAYAPAIRYEKGGEWPKHFYTFYSGMTDTLIVKRTQEKTILTNSVAHLAAI